MNIPNYISPEARKEIDELLKDRREASTREEKNKAREEIDRKVTKDTKSVEDKLN